MYLVCQTIRLLGCRTIGLSDYRSDPIWEDCVYLFVQDIDIHMQLVLIFMVHPTCQYCEFYIVYCMVDDLHLTI
jgi:hypothetical protein